MERLVEHDFHRPKFGGKIWVDTHGSCSYQCVFCRNTYYSAGTFEYHMLMHHGNQLRRNEMEASQPNRKIGKEEAQRELNGKGTSSSRNNTGSKRSDCSQPTGLKGENISKLACTKCMMTFDNLEQLRSHAREKHIYECVYCPRDAIKSFETEKGLWSHQRSEHESKFPRKCTICPRAFKRTHQLTEHIQSKHTRGHDVKCDFCPKILKSVFEKKNHIKTEHSDRRYYCHLCTEYRTTNEDNLRRHTRDKHPGQKQPHAW